MMTFTLAMQIDVAKREVAMRRNVYPRQVGLGKMRQHDAELQIAGMQAILQTLEELHAQADAAKAG